MPYTEPTAADLKLRFPAFADVDDAVVEYWLTDALLTVTTAWIEADYQPAAMSLAAHNMALTGLGTGGGAVADLADMGVTGFKSGQMNVSFAESAVSARASGGYASTKYGLMFLPYLRRNKGGPVLVGFVGC